MTKKKTEPTKLSGLFIVDVQPLNLNQEQLSIINLAIQKTIQIELAKIDDTEGIAGGPLIGIMGYRAS
ncbi:hypothetical protein ACLBW2_10070 [Enterobacteriaceae bacterium C23F]